MPYYIKIFSLIYILNINKLNIRYLYSCSTNILFSVNIGFQNYTFFLNSVQLRFEVTAVNVLTWSGQGPISKREATDKALGTLQYFADCNRTLHAPVDFLKCLWGMF